MDPGTNSQSNSNSQDPYLILGINEGASFDAIQEARDKKLIEAGEDQITKAKIEAAYDSLLMVSLKSRQLGNASNEAITASKKENEAKKVGETGPGPMSIIFFDSFSFFDAFIASLLALPSCLDLSLTISNES